MRRRLLLQGGLLGLLLVAATCGGDAERDAAPATPGAAGPETAQRAIHEQFLEDLATPRDASDGGGAVRLVLGPDADGSVRAGEHGRWEFEYVAGPLGIAEGGALFLLVPPFWGWSTPQVEAADYPGFTTVSTDAVGVALEAMTVDRNLLRIGVAGRALAGGEALRVVYGAGEALAKADDYAEARSPFWFKVDGDGDGVSGLVPDAPTIRVLPGPPARLTATLATTAPRGGGARLDLAVLDAMANAGCALAGAVELSSEPPGLELPERVTLTDADGGLAHLTVGTPTPGLFRVRARLVSDALETEALSNPLRVGDDVTPVLWGDLHGHSAYSDGTGTPADYYAYARDVAALDFAVLTDHDHFGVRFLDANPELWAEIREAAERFDQPGRFVGLLGYEWTSWLYGHRHVVYFDGVGEVLTSVGGSTTTPRELWDALAGRAALTFAHHSAGGPIATDWSFAPDPVLEPVTEVMSVHGSSEAADSPARIRGGVPGNFVRDQLDRGYRLGFVGSGDSHDGHPGHAHLSPFAGYRRSRPDPAGRRPEERVGTGGLAAVLGAEREPGALLAALRARRTYATSGPRIWLDVTLDGAPMGSALPAARVADGVRLRVEVAGTAELESVEVVRAGAGIQRHSAARFERALELSLESELAGLAAGDYVYVRVVQRDGGLAWSSPFFVE